MFEGLPLYSPDPILAVIDQYAQDPRPVKIDLGVGVYKDRNNETPVMRAVKKAEGLLLERETSKSYLGSGGNRPYAEKLAKLVLGDDLASALDGQVYSLQTVGGTGGLRLAFDLVRASSAKARVWVGTPSWANHYAIIQGAGLEVERYPHFDPETQAFSMAGVEGAIERASPGDVFLLHACCHNPSGIDPSIEQMTRILALMKAKGLFPVVDCAYAGFGVGLEADLTMARMVFAQFDEALICFSCSKNFGLYRERVGLILSKDSNKARVSNMKLGLLAIARANYSMPPNHGAGIVSEILHSPELSQMWLQELDEVRSDINRKRKRLSDRRINTKILSNIDQQRGMFSLLPISSEFVQRLKTDHAIYMTGDARINVVGLADDKEDYFINALMEIESQL